MYEHRQLPLLPHHRFVGRLTRHALGALALLLGIGVVLAPVAHRAMHHFHLDAKE